MSRPEAILSRKVLLELGGREALWLHPNVVGQGHPARIRALIARALEQHLEPRAAASAGGLVDAVLSRHHLRFGLGVGSPDLIGAYRGRFFGLELKSPSGRVRPDQARWHEAARAKGMKVDVVRSVDEAAGVIDLMGKQWEQLR